VAVVAALLDYINVLLPSPQDTCYSTAGPFVVSLRLFVLEHFQRTTGLYLCRV
jgi:hypothetical protein